MEEKGARRGNRNGSGIVGKGMEWDGWSTGATPHVSVPSLPALPSCVLSSRAFAHFCRAGRKGFVPRFSHMHRNRIQLCLFVCDTTSGMKGPHTTGLNTKGSRSENGGEEEVKEQKGSIVDKVNVPR